MKPDTKLNVYKGSDNAWRCDLRRYKQSEDTWTVRASGFGETENDAVDDAYMIYLQGLANKQATADWDSQHGQPDAETT